MFSCSSLFALLLLSSAEVRSLLKCCIDAIIHHDLSRDGALMTAYKEVLRRRGHNDDEIAWRHQKAEQITSVTDILNENEIEKFLSLIDRLLRE